MLIISEKINSSRKSIADAIKRSDVAFIQKVAKDQEKAGADYIDVNAGSFPGEQEEKLKWLMESVQEVTDIPLCIDSPDASVIDSVLPFARKTPMINSITLEPVRLDKILSLAVQHGCKVVGLCQSEEKLAETAEEKLRMASELIEKSLAEGLALDNLYIDPLVQPLAASTQSALATLDAISMIMTEFPGVHTTCGLTNVSYGLPSRKLVNRTFLVAAIMNGLDSAIIDPTDNQLYGALRVALMVAGKDDYCREYITAFRGNRL